MRTLVRFTTLVLTLVLVACADRHSSGPPPDLRGSLRGDQSPYVYRPCDGAAAAAPDLERITALPGGIWRGTYTNDTARDNRYATAVVAEDGRFWITADHEQLVGLLSATGNTFFGTGTAFSGGSTWDDGSLVTDLVLVGTVTDRDTLDGSFTLAAGDTGCVSFDYDPDTYEQPSSLSRLGGNWQVADSWGFLWELVVDADGGFVWRNPYFCEITGRLGLIDDRYNLYEVRDAVDACAPDDPAYTGLAYIDRTPDSIEPKDILVIKFQNGITRISDSYYRPHTD